ncbi:MAG: DUF4093 domain-containing protein [Ruminococcaceae bacterium]|nr:DUF4093 domain-containing protein [Oscillospiraceae bacterium]
MIKIKEAIIVEGTYDKIKLSGIFDTLIVTTDGFDIFKNQSKVSLIKKLAEKDGIIILTDSDRAGFVIRNYVKNFSKDGIVKHAYIPEIEGKEKRKSTPSKEGFLGVEGISDDMIIKAVEKCATESNKEKRLITKADLFMDGLSGGENSFKYRKILTKELDLPKRISANMLLDVLNSLFTYEEYKEKIKSLR